MGPNGTLYGADNIRQHICKLAYFAQRCDIASYWAGTGDASLAFLRIRENSRIIVGGLGTRFKAVSMAHATERFKARTRYLEGCHVKLYIFYTGRIVKAVVGSMNLGGGLPYELAVEVSGQPAKDCCMHFNSMWNEAEPVKPDELRQTAARLASSTFEA